MYVFTPNPLQIHAVHDDKAYHADNNSMFLQWESEAVAIIIFPQPEVQRLLLSKAWKALSGGTVFRAI